MEQIIRGIRDDRLRTRFLSTPDLTLDTVIQKVLADEKVKLDTKTLKLVSNHSNNNDNQVSRINANYTKKKFVKKIG